MREHFSRNDRGQKDLLERVQGYKRETVKPTAGSATTRLGGGKYSEIDAPSAWSASGKPIWAVFAPVADLHCKLGAVLSVLKQLRAAPDDHELVLWLPDWVCVNPSAAPFAATCCYSELCWSRFVAPFCSHVADGAAGAPLASGVANSPPLCASLPHSWALGGHFCAA